MTKPKFTKAPWNLGICEQASPYNTVQVPTIFVSGYTICTLSPKDKRDKDGNWRGFDEDLTEVKANAALMKMSPEMYAMLEELYDNLNRGIKYIISRLIKNGCPIDLARKRSSSNIELARRIKALLKKARGEE